MGCCPELGIEEVEADESGRVCVCAMEAAQTRIAVTNRIRKIFMGC